MTSFRFASHALLASAALLGATLSPAAPAANGQQLFANQCVACHGANAAGNAAMQAPPLAGTDAAYIARQLRQFRAGARGGEAAQGPAATMRAVAQSLPDDAAIDALARHIGRLKASAVKPEAPVPAAELNTGKALFSVCVACHGSQGEGNSALAAPRLTHLPAWYLRAQLQAFRAGARGYHPDDRPGQQMHQVALELLPDDAAVKAVVAYLSTLTGSIQSGARN